jgi:6-phospho-beta-glucosidase
VDETFPLEFGCVGQETTGAGGLAKALRTVPVVLDVAERVRTKASPDAWIVNFTNPVGIVTRALLDTGHRAIGLCNVAIGYQLQFAALLGVEPTSIELDHVGLNHLTWIREVFVEGKPCLAELLAEHADSIADRSGTTPDVLHELGVVPSYYVHYFWQHDEVVKEQQQAASVPRAQQVADLERQLLEMYADPALDTKPALLEQRGGAYYSEAAVDLVAALLGDRGNVQVVDVRNKGTLPFLPDEAVVEVPARIGSVGGTPVDVAPLDPLVAGLVAHVAAYEQLALDAAREGGRERVERALLAHPLIGQQDLAARLADVLIDKNRAHLPWAR